MGKLKLPNLFIEYEVRDRDGNLLEKKRLKSQTWVGNIVCLLASLLGFWESTTSVAAYVTSTGRTSLLDTTNTARSILLRSVSGAYHGAMAPAGVTTAGIVVGSSDTPVSIGQYALLAQIAHGSGSGQLLYGASTYEDVVKNASWFFRLIRTFTNNSGATVTVRELGLYCVLASGGQSSMLARDVPPSPISVPNGSTLTVRYIISHSLS